MTCKTPLLKEISETYITVRVWMINYIHVKQWDMINNLCPYNINDSLVILPPLKGVGEWLHPM